MHKLHLATFSADIKVIIDMFIESYFSLENGKMSKVKGHNIRLKVRTKELKCTDAFNISVDSCAEQI